MLLDTRGSTARVAHLEEVVAPPEIKPPGEEFDELGRIWYDTCCSRSRFTNSSKRAGTARGRRLRSAAVDSFKRDENEQKAPAVAHDPVRTACPREVHAATH